MSYADPDERPSRLRSLLGGLAKLLLVVAVFGLTLEILITLVFGQQVRFPRRVVDGGFGLRINEPGASYRHTSPEISVSFRINGQGMRADREYTYEKPPGLKRIVSVGDSFTVGYEVAVDDCFTSVLENELVARGHDVEALNAGVSGYGNAEALLYLERELFEYGPDVVILSFYNNDLVDNVRSNLFRLEQDRLIPMSDSYVPLGRFGDFLNRNLAFNLLSERSNAFALVKERANRALKKRAVEENIRHVEGGGSEEVQERMAYQRRLAAAIVRRMHEVVREHGAELVVQSIPLFRPDPGGGRLVDAFPLEGIDPDAEGLHLLPATSFLEPHLGQQKLYHERSHTHWTPYSHALSGKALADLIEREGILGGSD